MTLLVAGIMHGLCAAYLLPKWADRRDRGLWIIAMALWLAHLLEDVARPMGWLQ